MRMWERGNGVYRHEKLCEAAKSAIDEVVGDVSVSLETTLASLKDIQEHLEMRINGLEMDVAGQEKE